MSTVLVTGVGGAGGIGAVRWLTEQTPHEVVGVDMDPQAAGLYLADAGRVVPPASDDDWAAEIASVVAELDVDVVVPTVDEELTRLTSLSEILSDVPIVAPRAEVVDVALDKYRTYERLRDAGHAVPETWLAAELPALDTLPEPLLVKPRRGRGSRGIHRLEHAGDLEELLAETDADPESLLVQELIEGTEYTTSVVETGDGRLLGVVPKVAFEKDGSTTTGVTRESAVVDASCRSLAETLEPRGPMNVQQIVADGVAYTIEINPRFSSTSCLTAAAGIDEFDLLIRDSLGEDVSTDEDFEEDLYLRRYRDHVVVPGEEFESPGRSV